MIHPLKLCKEQLHIWKICYRIGSTIAVNSDQHDDNADTSMPIFSAASLEFAVAV